MSLNVFISRLDHNASNLITDLLSKGTTPDIIAKSLDNPDFTALSDSRCFTSEIQSALSDNGYDFIDLSTDLQSCKYYRRCGYVWDDAFSTYLTDNCICKLDDYTWVIDFKHLTSYFKVSVPDQDVSYMIVEFG